MGVTGLRHSGRAGFDTLAALIDAPDNRHRAKGRACVGIGVQGGRARYMWLERETLNGREQIAARLFGHAIALALPPGPHPFDLGGCLILDPRGWFTDCTRDAFGVLLSIMAGDPYPANNGRCELRMPGAKGGANPGPWTLTVYVGGQSYTMTEGDGAVTIPARGEKDGA